MLSSILGLLGKSGGGGGGGGGLMSMFGGGGQGGGGGSKSPELPAPPPPAQAPPIQQFGGRQQNWQSPSTQPPPSLNFQDMLALRMKDRMTQGGGSQVQAPALPAPPPPAVAPQIPQAQMFGRNQGGWQPPRLQNLGMGSLYPRR